MRGLELAQEIRLLRKSFERRIDVVLIELEKLRAAVENMERTDNSFVGLVTNYIKKKEETK